MVTSKQKDTVNIRDQLGERWQVGTEANQAADVNLIIPSPYREEIGAEELPNIFQERSIEDAFILGHATNAILGTSTVGVGSMTSFGIIRVINRNDIFREYFKDTELKDTDNTTADWSTTYSKCRFNTGEVLQLKRFFEDNRAASNIKITITAESSRSYTLAVDTSQRSQRLDLN